MFVAGHTVLVLRLSVAYDGSIYAAAAMRPIATVTVATCLIKRLGVATVRHPSYKVRPSDRVTDRILRHLSSDEQLAENKETFVREASQTHALGGIGSCTM